MLETRSIYLFYLQTIELLNIPALNHMIREILLNSYSFLIKQRVLFDYLMILLIKTNKLSD